MSEPDRPAADPARFARPRRARSRRAVAIAAALVTSATVTAAGLAPASAAALSLAPMTVAPMTPAAAGTPADYSDLESPSPAPLVRATPRGQVMLRFEDSRITETSGLVRSSQHQGVYWTSSGGQLFAVDGSGRTVAAYALPGGSALRVEALAMSKDAEGKPQLLIGDIGDPEEERTKGIGLITAAEPASLTGGALETHRYVLAYPDGPHQAQVLVVDPKDDRAYIVTDEENAAYIYALPSVLGPRLNRLIKVRPLYVQAEDGTFLPDGRLVLRGLSLAHVYAGIRGDKTATVRIPRSVSASGAVAATSDGKAILVTAKSGTAMKMASFALDGVPGPAPSLGELGNTDVAPIKETKSPLPGGIIGTTALAGLGLVALTGLVLFLRGRRQRQRVRTVQAGAAEGGAVGPGMEQADARPGPVVTGYDSEAGDQPEPRRPYQAP